MGNSFFCKQCDIEKFQLSRECADQFLADNNKTELSSEDIWRLKLRCLDDAHARQNCVTQEGFDELMAAVESHLNKSEGLAFCKTRDRIIECLELNPNCMLNCKHLMEDFIDCIDTIRIKKIKEKVQQQRTKKKIS